MRRSANGEARIRRALAVSGGGVDSEELLREVLDEWGGAKALAQDMKASHDSAPPGSMIRQRYMEMIQRLIINNTKEDIASVIEPSELSDDELFQLARTLVGRMADGDDGGAGTPTRPGDAGGVDAAQGQGGAARRPAEPDDDDCYY